MEENLEIVMKKEMYVAAMKGKVEETQSWTDESIKERTNEKNNIIHIATQYEQHKFIKAILENFHQGKELLSEKNSKEDTPLHVAAEIGNYDIVSLMIDYLEKNVIKGKKLKGANKGDESVDHGKPWMAKNLKGNTAIHVAIMHDNVKIAMFLLDKDHEFARCLNYADEAPLHLAIKQHVNYSEIDSMVERVRRPIDKGGASIVINIAPEEKMADMIKALIEKASYVASWPDKKGLTPLHRAASLSSPYNVQIIKSIIEHWPQSAEVCDSSGKSILHHLVNKIPNYKEVRNVLSLKEIYTLRNRQDQLGNTPLYLAAKSKDIHMVRVLLESSTKLNINNNEGICAASVIQQQNVIQILRQRKMTEEESDIAEKANIAYLKERKDNLGMDFLLSQDSKGKNILHKLMHIKNGSRIVRENYVDFIKEVLEIFPALVRQTDHTGNTPVHILVRNNDINIHIDSQNDNNNNNNLQITSDQDNNNIVQPSSLWKSNLLTELLDICCKCIAKIQKEESNEENNNNTLWSVQNTHGNTPLHEAVIAKNKLLVLKLLEHDQYPARIVNKRNETPLHLLADGIAEGNKKELKAEDIIKKIVEAYEEAAGLPDKDGLTPIMRAVKKGNLHVAEVLCTLSPTAATICDEKGKTFWHLLFNHPSDYLMYRFFKIMKLRDLLKQPDYEGNTPLHQAIGENRFDVVKNILEVWKNESRLPNKAAQGEVTKDDEGHYELSKGLMDLIRAPYKRRRPHGKHESESPQDKEGSYGKDNVGHRSSGESPKDQGHEQQGQCHWLMKLLRISKNKGSEPGLSSKKDKDHERSTLPAENNGKWLIDLLTIPNKAGKTPGDLIAASECFPSDIQKKINKEYAMVGFRSVWGIPTTQIETYVNTMGIIAALLATITFTTAFTVPGGLFENIGTPIMIGKIAFHVFMISDVIAMCLSMMVLIVILKIMATSNKRKSVMTLDLCITLLLISLCVTLVTFMTGFFAAMYSVRRWMAIVTIVLCSLLILLVLQFLISKLLLPFRINLIFNYLLGKITMIMPNSFKTKQKKEVDDQGPTQQRPENIV